MIKKAAFLFCLTSVALLASGYRIGVQSASSVAMSASDIAGTIGADAAYYNPANISWMRDGSVLENSINTIVVEPQRYKDARGAFYNGSSKREAALVPTLFFASKKDRVGFGVSLTVPAALAIRWDSPYPRTFANEFFLKAVELNPSLSYKLSDTLSLAAGARAVYSEGRVKSDGFFALSPVVWAQRDMEGDSLDFGYNLALSYKPTKRLALAATYRSKVDLTLKGDAKLSSSYNGLPSGLYSGGASVVVPLPASFALAASYEFLDTRVAFAYDKTVWSDYKSLDFRYKSDIGVVMQPIFDEPVLKRWRDSDAFSIGVAHTLSDSLTLKGGFSFIKSAIPDSTLGFDLPDGDIRTYSFGCDYKIDEKITLGSSFLYADKARESAVNNIVNGSFEGDAYLFSLSASYRF